MPRFRQFSRDGGRYVLAVDRNLPPSDQVVWHYRHPTPLDIAEFESQAGYLKVEGSSENAGGGAPGVEDINTRWVSNSQGNGIRALLRFLTDVAGPGPAGKPLCYPKPGEQVYDEGAGGNGAPAMRSSRDSDRLEFLAIFTQEDLYEVADSILDGARLTEEESGNSDALPSSSLGGATSTTRSPEPSSAEASTQN